MKMRNYETMSEAVNDLVKRGYTHDFNIDKNCLVCVGTTHQLSPKDFEIDEVYRFEGETDPGDENIVYAISSPKYGLKGILVNAFGLYADADSAELVSHLQKHLER